MVGGKKKSREPGAQTAAGSWLSFLIREESSEFVGASFQLARQGEC
jgi:hypothetical protein